MGKRFEYDSSKNHEPIIPDTIESLTSIPLAKWISSTGLINGSLPNDFIDFSHFTIGGEYPTVRITAKNENLNFRARYNLQASLVYIEYLEISDSQKGYASIIFSHLVLYSRYIGFEILDCRASADLGNNGKKLVGYLVWGKFGFTMKENDHLTFLSQMNDDNRREKCLQKLLWTSEGFEYWKDHGKSWFGTFKLSSASLNFKMYRKFRKRK